MVEAWVSIAQKEKYLVIDLEEGSWQIPAGEGSYSLPDVYIPKWTEFQEAFWPRLCAIPEVQRLIKEFGGGFIPK